MNIHTRFEPGLLVVTPHEERLDAPVAVAFRQAVEQFLAQTEGEVVLDLARVSYLDSSALGAIVAIYKGLDRGRRFVICGLRPNVAKVFSLTRLDKVLTLAPNEAEAIALCRA